MAVPRRVLRGIGLGSFVIFFFGVALAGITFTEKQRRDIIAAAERLTEGILPRATREAEAGSLEAQLMLAIVYSRGGLVARDPAQAVKWLEIAADQFHLMALDGLAVYYARGEAVPHDHARALDLTKRAAEMGYAAAWYLETRRPPSRGT
jgi:TPR repeat protein